MTLRRRKYPSGNVAWQIDYALANGKRMQISLRTKDEALAEMARLRGELRAAGESLLMVPEAERAALMTARARVVAVGATVDEAVAFFLAHSGKRVREAVTWEVLRKRCVEAKREGGARARYVTQLGSVARSFGRAGHDALLATEITTAMIVKWLQANDWEPKTQNNYRTDLQTIFAWAMASGLATLNPATMVPMKSLKETLGDDEVEYLSAEQCAALFARASLLTEEVLPRDRRGRAALEWGAAEDHRLLVPVLVLGLFCGLRPEREIGLMTWAAIRLEEGLVVVSCGRSKTRQRRTIDLSPNAVAWLKWCQDQGMGKSDAERVVPRNFIRRWARLREACGLLKSWPHDGLRHTFATMHIAEHRDESKLQLLMGHTSAAMIYQHYRGLTTPAEAARFWRLMPNKG